MKYLCASAVLSLALCAGACSRGDQAVQAIAGGTLVDGSPNPPVSPSTVLVKRGRIVAAGPAADVPIPPDANRIPAAGLFVFPLDPREPIRAGADANLLLLKVNPAVEQDYLKNVAGRMETGRWTKYPRNE